MTKVELIKLLSDFPDDYQFDNFGVDLKDKGRHKIHIYPPNIKSVDWCTEDFAWLAEKGVGEYWHTYYDEDKFEYALSEMINDHDAELGITWDTVDYYLKKYCCLEEDTDD